MKEIINYSFAEVISCTLVSVAVGVKYMMEIDYYLNKKPQPFHSCGNMKYLLLIHHKAGNQFIKFSHKQPSNQQSIRQAPQPLPQTFHQTNDYHHYYQ